MSYLYEIRDEKARGHELVMLNGLPFQIVPRITWRKVSVAPNTKVWSKKSYIWAPTESWKKYCAFKDAIAALVADKVWPLTLLPGDHVVFHMPMPQSWSQKKKLAHDGEPHEAKPDLDNLIGGFFDAMFPGQSKGGKGDQHMHTLGSMKKVWAWEGAIEIGRPT